MSILSSAIGKELAQAARKARTSAGVIDFGTSAAAPIRQRCLEPGWAADKPVRVEHMRARVVHIQARVDSTSALVAHIRAPGPCTPGQGLRNTAQGPHTSGTAVDNNIHNGADMDDNSGPLGC
jgi:hypothetical protein